jgi:DegV family protein with EDD domain
MTVKIVTDTLSDITGDLAAKLGVTVVPLYVRFGETLYRDRVEISTDEFYRRLINEGAFPSTTQPTPNDFLEVYEFIETDEILVVVVSSNSAAPTNRRPRLGAFEERLLDRVIDSQSVAQERINRYRCGQGG